MVEILKSKHHFLDLVQVGFILTDVHSKILYANRYVEQLFGYAREEIEEQRIRVLFLEEDLTYLLPNIVYLTPLRNFSREATEKRISFNLDTGTLGGEESLFIDRDLVIKALSHILENSIEATLHRPPERKQKTVKVGLFGDEEDVGVSISDNGEGIPKKNLPHIFDPFFSTRPGKVGLGLTLVKRVVEEHGGGIRMESRSKRGTTATLIFRKDRRRKLRKELISPN